MWSFLLLYRSSLITWDPICQSLALFSKQYKVLAYAAILKRFCALSSIGVLGLPLALLPVNTQSQYTVTMDLQDTPDPYPPKHRHHFISTILLLHDITVTGSDHMNTILPITLKSKVLPFIAFPFGTIALSLGMLQFFLVCGEVDTLCSICGKRHSVGAGVHMCRREARGLCQVSSLTAFETWSLTELSAHWLARMAGPPTPQLQRSACLYSSPGTSVVDAHWPHLASLCRCWDLELGNSL